MNLLVTGGAGFIGSNLSARLISLGHSVTVFDNLSAGSLDFLSDVRDNRRFRFFRGDILELPSLLEAMAGVDAIFHLAANSDITQSRIQTDLDLRQGTIGTFNVLEAMRQTGVNKIIFSSSSVIYGESAKVPTPEDCGPSFPISLYGASKLACEGLISAFCHNFAFQAWIFRFANICGLHGTHGVIFDFIRKLQKDPSTLKILGDGRQAKPYLHVSDCVGGILFGWQNAAAPLNYFNLGCEGATNVKRIAEMVADAMKLTGVQFEYSGGERGWVGDVPQVRLDCGKFSAFGWRASMPSDEAVELATRQLVGELSCKS